ncbi:MAG: rRNA pseudouridine synthase [Clostridia bacterium]|nr:rRNA pseudouridine synthase [Clostridia bacterium]
MRLQKYLADAGIASRRKCEELIKEGKVTVNGSVAELGCSVSKDDCVVYDGKQVHPAAKKVVYAFYKPKNVICTSSENEDRIKVVDFFKDVPERLYTVGRLDYDSEGLIFLTNDGDFAEKLMHPRYMKTKTYRVLCTGEISKRDERTLMNGVMLDDGITAPAVVRVTKNGAERSELLISIHEGRNRQVRRMLEALGHKTIRLCRVAIGDVRLGSMKPGEKRLLTEEEISGFVTDRD